MSDVTVFAPSPTLTVTVEESGEIHVHAGGQGVWQARMLRRLGVSVTMCCSLMGEVGTVLKHLLEDEGFTVEAVFTEGQGSAYVHDRRDGQRTVVAETEGDPLGRHDLDELYGIALREGLASGLALLSGPAGEDALPADTYRRLAADLRTGGARVIVDLAGERMHAALAGGVDVLKVSDEELKAEGMLADGQEEDEGALAGALRRLRNAGADAVIVTRADKPLWMLDAEGFIEITTPRMQIADTRGAGDSLTAGLSAALVHGESVRDAVMTGAAAGALNVTRHGLGTGDLDAIAELRAVVTTREFDVPQPSKQEVGRVSPDGLAALARPSDEGAQR